jgi:hypothetical protein
MTSSSQCSHQEEFTALAEKILEKLDRRESKVTTLWAPLP